jgi:SMODS domain-containing protein
MATTVPKAFNEFATNIKPTDNQEQINATRRTAVQNFLVAKYPAASAMPLIEAKVIGSAGRKTLIRPVDDIDVFCIFDDSQVWPQYKNNSQQLLYRVREALTGYSVKVVGSRGQAVRLFYSSGPNVDITPAFPVKDIFGRPAGYYIPKGDGAWQQTDPYQHGTFMARRNEELGYHLKPLVRMLKRWNRAHSSRLSSFHLEIMAQASFSSLSGNTRSASSLFFTNAYSYLHVKDPAGYSGDLAGGLSSQQQLDIKKSFANAADRAARAQDAETNGLVTEALRQWRFVFGDDFPGYG